VDVCCEGVEPLLSEGIVVSVFSLVSFRISWPWEEFSGERGPYSLSSEMSSFIICVP
jgi:hypothetical protein